MPASDYARLFNRTDVVDNQGDPVRANTAPENTFFVAMINAIYSNPNTANFFGLERIAGLLGETLVFRSVPTISEDGGAGANNFDGKHMFGTLNDPEPDVSRYERDFFGDPTVHLNMLLTWQQLSADGQPRTRNTIMPNGTNTHQDLLHEIVHAYHDGISQSGSGYNISTDLEFEEQITIFMENFLYEKIVTQEFNERVGHSPYQPATHFGPSSSAISYLRDYDLTSYQFESGNLKATFRSADGVSITKTYIAGAPPSLASQDSFQRTAGADRIEIYQTGAGSLFSTGVLSEAMMAPVLQEAAALPGVLSIVQGHIAEFNELARSERHTFTPQALLAFSGERYIGGEKSVMSGALRVDVEGPRPDGVGVVELRVPSIFFGLGDLDTLVIGAAGWNGRVNSAQSTLEFTTGGGAPIDVITGASGDDILVTFSEADFNRLEGMSGNDLILGSAMIDVLRGGLGNDSLDGFDGADELFGDEGDDWLMGGQGSDNLQGGANDDVLWGGAGLDILDGGSGADVLAVDGLDVIRPGETIDRLYLRSFDPADQHVNRLKGGYRFVDVNDTQTQQEQILAMRNSTAPFIGAMREEYRVITTASGQGLEIKIANTNEIITIESWIEGEYGIHLNTERHRVASFNYLSLPSGGLVAGALGLTTDFIEIHLNTVLFIAERSYDPVWGHFAGSSFTLTQLDQLLGLPTIPPRSNSIEGGEGDDAMNGRLGDDRLLGHGGADQMAGLLGNDDLDGGSGADSLDGGFGADVLKGGEGNDTLTGGLGDDLIEGGAGADLILIRAGDGHDRIVADGGDIIRFADGVDPAEVIVIRSGAYGSAPEYGSITEEDGGFTLILGTDTVEVDGAFARIEFADGTVRTQATMVREAIAASTTAGDDVIVGAATPDRLAGGAGDDYLNGGGGNDRYYFARGDGHDRLDDPDGNADLLVFADDIAPGDILVTSTLIATGPRAGEQLARLAIAGTGDWVEFPVRDLEEVRFADGTSWSRYEIGSRAMEELTGSGDDVLSSVSIFQGVVRPGAGDDLLTVDYRIVVQFGRGSDLDRIENAHGYTFGAIVDVDADVGLGELRFSRLPDGVAMWIDGTGDRVEGDLETGLVRVGGEAVAVGALADLDDNAAQRLTGTAAGETINGSADGDRISAGGGDDTVAGGDGADLLFGGAGNDNVAGGAARDFLFGEAGDDLLDGGDGDDVLSGGTGADTLLGGAGNDALSGNGSSVMTGGTGADTISARFGDRILYNLGDGADTVHLSSSFAVGQDGSTALKRSEIEFGTGITAAATTVTLQGWSIFINVNGSTTDRIRLDRLAQHHDLPSIRFIDGTVWQESDIYAKLFNPNNGNDTPNAVVSAEPDWGGNTIQYVYGGGGNDSLRFTGLAGESYFLFAPGGGNDTILATSGSGRLRLLGFDVDALQVARSGAALENFTLSFAGSTDTVTIQSQLAGNGASKVTRIDLNGSQLAAADLNRLYIAQRTSAGDDTIHGFDGTGGVVNIGTSENPIWTHPVGNDVLAGGLGNDLMIGGSGDDTYIVSDGDGQDTVRDISLFNANNEAGYDVLQIEAESGDVSFSRSTSDLDDLVITFEGSTQSILVDQFFAKGRIEEFQFGDGVIYTAADVEALAIAGSATSGADTIRGTASPESLAGGLGNDTLDGLGGSDRYSFNLGDGNDVISDTGTAESNTLALGAGIAFEALALTRTGNDLRIDIAAGDSITVTGHFSGAMPKLGQLVFADGSRKSAAEIAQAMLDQAATASADTITGFSTADALSGGGGNDTLNGGAGDDVLDGGTGNDALNGQQGADRYAIARGDGNDVVASTGDGSAVDIVAFDATIGGRDVYFVRPTPTSPDLIVHVRGGSQTVTIANYFTAPALAGFEFADGTVLAPADVTAALANAAPTVTAATWEPEIEEGGQVFFAVPDDLFDDDQGVADLRYEATLASGAPLPAWLTFNGLGFLADAGDADAGTISIRLTAVDRHGLTVDRLIDLDLVNLAEAPVATATLPVQSAPIGSAFSYGLPGGLFTDEDSGDVLAVTARLANGDPLPAWLSFDGTTFSGTPAAGDSGPLAIEVVATDSFGLAEAVPLSLRVGTANQAPAAGTLADIAATEDLPFQAALPDTLFTDADPADRLVLTATLAGGGALPAWLQFDGREFSGMPGNADVGTLALTITATDIFGATASSAVSIVVAGANDAPVAANAIEDQLATQGQAFSFTLPSNIFSDPDAGDGLTLSVTLSDGTPLPDWLSYASGAISGTPGADDTGLIQVRVTATDAAGSQAYDDFLLGVMDVNDAPTVEESLAPIFVPVSDVYTFQIPSSLFADSDDPGYRLVVTLADGSALPGWISFDPDFERLAFAPWISELQGRSAAEATIGVRITAVDSRGASISTILDVTVEAPDVDQIVNTGGSGVIYGTILSERMIGTSINDMFYSNGGVDRIVFGIGSGQDTIRRGNGSFSGYPLGNVVELGAGVDLAELVFTRVNDSGGVDPNGSSLDITIIGTSDRLRIQGQFRGDADEEPTVRELQFADGTRVSAAELLATYLQSTGGNDIVAGGPNADVINGGGGNDTIYGNDGADLIDGGAGNDLMYGDFEYSVPGSSDVFLFYRGAGQDRIVPDSDNDAPGRDILRFGPDIAPEDLIVTHIPGAAAWAHYSGLADPGSLLIQISGTADSLQIYRQFLIEPFEGQPMDSLGIERFEFADGTVMDRAQFEALIAPAAATSGADLVYGGAAADLLAGGAGNDKLVGEDGNDTYIYRDGDGDDVIRETESIYRRDPFSPDEAQAGNVISTDTLALGAGILPEDLIFTRPDADGENLVISFTNRPGSITIEGQFRTIFHDVPVIGNGVGDYFGIENAAIDAIRFADGRSWSLADIYAHSVRATAGDDVVDGFFRRTETLDGGAGNDLLSGRNGDDTYVFARGYGHDAVKEFAFYYPDNAVIPGFPNWQYDEYYAADRIKFVGVASTEVTTGFDANGGFVFTIINTGETLTITPESEFGNFTAIEFSNTTWSKTTFQSKWAVTATPTAGNDTIYGFLANDVLTGGDGADTLKGNQGVDSLDGGNGDDTLILEAHDGDSASGGAGNDIFRLEGSVQLGSPLNVREHGRLDYEPRYDAGQEYATINGGADQDLLIVQGSIEDYWSGTRYLINNGDGSYSFDNGSITIRDIETVQFSDGTFTVADLAAATSPFYPGTILGTAGNDVLNGTSGIDALFGMGGNDTLNGLDGNDILRGGTGTDTYNGGLGTDILELLDDAVAWTVNLATNTATQGATTETLNSIEGAYGTAAADTFTGNALANVFRGNGGNDVVSAGDGDDIIEIDVNAGFDSVDGGLGSDTIRALRDNSVIGLTNVVGVETITANGFSNVTLIGSTNADTLNLTGATLTGIDRIDGSSGNDTITGTALADIIIGGSGDDVLNGGTGDDVFQRGSSSGFDTVNGGDGADTIIALNNNVVIGLVGLTAVETISAGGFSNVSIGGSSGIDTIDLTAVALVGITRVDGGSGADILTGSAAADTILGGSGDDTLAGGLGDDLFQVSGASAGFDAVNGGDGNDTLQATANSTMIGLRSVTALETITAGAFTGVYISGSSSADTLDFTGVTLTGIVRIDAGGGSDIVTGSGGNDTILGGAGDDTLAGGLGNDVFQVSGTGAGFDSVSGGGGTDTISATANSTVIGLRNVSGVETISAGAFTGVYIAGSTLADTLDLTGATLTGIVRTDGGAGNDVITGSGGNDTILGGAGDDTLAGGLGNDIFQVNGTSAGFDAYDGGGGTDTISATANSTAIGLTSVTGIETISAGSFTGVYILGSANADTLNFTGVTLTAIVRTDGGAGNDLITGSGGNDTILGGGGDDTLAGALGNDIFQVSGTSAGFDAYDGGGGTDTISATAASTAIGISSLTAIETVTGGSFTGVYIRGSGNADTLNFSAVTLTAIARVEGGSGNDVITGNTAANTIWGGIGNDIVSGGSGNDSLLGDDGDDILIGGAGNDTLNGGNNTDTVDYSYATANWTINLSAASAQGVSGSETDTISNVENAIGGSGADTITGTTAANTLTGGGGNDRLRGNAGNDLIQGGLGTDIAVFAGLQASYSIVTGGGSVQIVDNQPGTDGNDGTDTVVGIETAEFKNGVQVSISSPIVLDLDGDGAELVARSQSRARFDWNGDGVRDATGWVGDGDGFLTLDRNHDGTVSGGNELSFVDDKAGARSDLDGLSAFDSNLDGMLSAADLVWADFHVWRDGDGDGNVDAGEYLSMDGAGIASISLTGAATERTWGWEDNIVINDGTFTRSDGTTAGLADVALNYSANPGRSAMPIFRRDWATEQWGERWSGDALEGRGDETANGPLNGPLYGFDFPQVAGGPGKVPAGRSSDLAVEAGSTAPLQAIDAHGAFELAGGAAGVSTFAQGLNAWPDSSWIGPSGFPFAV